MDQYLRWDVLDRPSAAGCEDWAKKEQGNGPAKSLFVVTDPRLSHTMFACRRGGGVTCAVRPSSQDLDRTPGRQQQDAAVGSDLLVVLDLTSDVIILPPVDDKKI
jgi:hypothetical protein